MNKPRSGMPVEIADGIRKLGKQFSPELIRETIAMYAGIPRTFDVEDIDVVRDIAYGGDQRHRLDIHVPKRGRAEKNAGVVVFVHGGGFIRGDRASRRHIPDFFAANGFVGVNVTHRLAPEHTWPAGGLDMGAAVTWLHANVAGYGGDPRRIILMGESAGAFHVATYVFRPDLFPPATPGVAGAVMVSGPFLVDTQNYGEGEAAYFGDDKSRWGEEVAFPGNITRTEIPVLFTLTEYDPPHIDEGFAIMIHELIVKHHATPRFRLLTGHNHISSFMSIGTPDTMLSDEILDFISANNQSTPGVAG